MSFLTAACGIIAPYFTDNQVTATGLGSTSPPILRRQACAHHGSRHKKTLPAMAVFGEGAASHETTEQKALDKLTAFLTCHFNT